MRLTVHRIHDTGKATIGYLLVDGKFHCFTLEDEFRKVKQKGETRIKEGLYKLAIMKADTPLTLKHRTSYGSWFKYHIEITGVPEFTGIYIHAGNDETHTDGCLLVGNILHNPHVVLKNQLGDSITATKNLYSIIYPLLEKGEQVTIEFIQVY